MVWAVVVDDCSAEREEEESKDTQLLLLSLDRKTVGTTVRSTLTFLIIVGVKAAEVPTNSSESKMLRGIVVMIQTFRNSVVAFRCCFSASCFGEFKKFIGSKSQTQVRHSTRFHVDRPLTLVKDMSLSYNNGTPKRTFQQYNSMKTQIK